MTETGDPVWGHGTDEDETDLSLVSRGTGDCIMAAREGETLLAVDEQTLLSGYRTLDTVKRLATKCYLVNADMRLVEVIYGQVFLGLRPGGG